MQRAYVMTRARAVIALYRARLDDFEESKHPRDPHGKFGEGGGGPSVESSGGGSHPEFAGTKRSTEDLHKKGGEWTPERAKLHKAYVASVMAGVPKSESPTVYMTGGGPAAGKSVALLKNPTVGIPGKSAAVHADPDGAKESIPEFSQNKHSEDRTVATRVHEESAAMSQMAVREALRQGRNVVYDSSGDGGIAKLEAKVATMRENGAERVIANYVTIDIKDAIRRSDERAKTEGRFVPHAYLEQVHRDVTRTTIAAIQRGVYDSLDLWDNSGKTVVHVASYTRGTGLKVIDQSAWDSFQKRGE